jgi:hypothetical protein
VASAHARHRGGLILVAVIVASCTEPDPRQPEVASLNISADSLTLVESRSVSLTFTALDPSGAAIANPEVNWRSRDETIAVAGGSPQYEVAPYISARRPGRTVVVAQKWATGGVSEVLDSIVVYVQAATVATVVVGPAAPVLVPGQTVQLAVAVKESQGGTLDRPVTWSSQNAVATVSSSGVVTAAAPGVAFIDATSGGVTGTLRVVVTATSLSYDYYKRGGSTTPATAMLTLSGPIASGGTPATLAIDGQSLAMMAHADADGVGCLLSASQPGVITSCVSRRSPRVILLCQGPINGPYVAQYIMLLKDDPDRQASSASEVLSAMQAAPVSQALQVFDTCTNNPPRWTRNANNTFFRFPNTTTSYSVSDIAALMSGAMIYKGPGSSGDPNNYAVVRIGSGLFEVWH